MNDTDQNQKALEAAQAANSLHANHEPVQFLRTLDVDDGRLAIGRCGCGVELIAASKPAEVVEAKAKDSGNRRVFVNDKDGK